MNFICRQVSIEFPYVLVQTVIYGTIFYSMGSFEWTMTKFLWYMYFMYFTLLYFTFFGMMTTAITPNHKVAPIISAPFYTLWNLFCGFMITYKVITKNTGFIFVLEFIVQCPCCAHICRLLIINKLTLIDSLLEETNKQNFYYIHHFSPASAFRMFESSFYLSQILLLNNDS